MLEGDNTIEDLIVISFYDSVPVYFLSSVVTTIDWATVMKQAFSKKLKKNMKMRLLSPDFINNYNLGMNSVGRADFLRKNYQICIKLRKRKWWWSILFWAFGVDMVNTYLCKKSWHEMYQLITMSH